MIDGEFHRNLVQWRINYARFFNLTTFDCVYLHIQTASRQRLHVPQYFLDERRYESIKRPAIA